MYFLPAEQISLYRNFKSLESADFSGIIRFYEQHESGIRALDLEHYLDCTLLYTEALFEAAQHRKHIVMCDHLLELVIVKNIDEWEGQDLYHAYLFKKACSFYILEAFFRAEKLFREILKIYPHDRLSAVYLNKCLLAQKPAWLPKIRTGAVLMALIAVILIAVEWLLAPAFFSQYQTILKRAHTLMLGASLAGLSLAEAFHGLRCWSHTRQFVKQAFRRKQSQDQGFDTFAPTT